MMFQVKGCKAVQSLAVAAGAALSGAFLSASAAFAQGADFLLGAPRAGQMTLPVPVTPIAREMNFFHDAILLPIITVICLFVLDTSQGIAGPYCATQLAALGANVVKVEPPAGDWSRGLSSKAGTDENDICTRDGALDLSR
jgi:hypothetical protein